jgi:putative transcriptional regulator
MNTINVQKVAEFLYRKRVLKGYNQSQVAEAVGITQSYYNYIESGKRRPSPKVALAIGQLLGFNHMVFFGDKIPEELKEASL